MITLAYRHFHPDYPAGFVHVRAGTIVAISDTPHRDSHRIFLHHREVNLPIIGVCDERNNIHPFDKRIIELLLNFDEVPLYNYLRSKTPTESQDSPPPKETTHEQ